MCRYGLVLLGLALVPSTALAVEVECSNEDGSCTVSNDGGIDSVDCTCDGAVAGSTGGNMWAGLDEDEMDEVCLGELELCGGFGTTFGGTTFGGTTFGGTTFGGSTFGSSFGSSFGETGVFTDTAATSFGVTTDPTDSVTDGFTTTSGKGTGGPGSDTTGASDSLGLTTTGGEPDTTSGPVDPDTTSGPVDPSDGETNDNDESGDADDSGQPETTTEETGCGCTTAGPEGGFAMALGLFGLLGLRRRPRWLTG